MLPRRLGVRFALEALFLLGLAVGAGLADLRPALIVVVMAVAWVIVALIEFTAERIASSPVSYLVSGRADAEAEEPQRVFRPRPEERTVVAPPERPAETKPEAEEPPARKEPAEPEPEPGPEDEPQLEPAAESEPEPQPEPFEPEPPAEAAGAPEPRPRRRLRSLLRRREPELERTPPAPPRHVKLLPRRSAPEPSRASRDVAELFGSRENEEREETGGR